tara:strand:- start:2821 stop:3048 length:228 start_codon:yes stop_codon:yes gene_type:complete
MKLYRIDTGEGWHYAKTKGALKRALVELEAEYADVSILEFHVNSRGIFDALREGANAAGGHLDGYPSVYGEPDYE